MAATQETKPPTTTPTSTWTLALATVDDMTALVDVHTAAFRADHFSQLMLLGRPDGAHQALMRKSLEHWFNDPSARLTKAVDSDGHVVAWACWVLRDNDSTTTKAAEDPPKQKQKEHAADAVDEAKEKKTTASPPEAPAAETVATKTTATTATSSTPNVDPVRALGGRMREDVLRREAAYMPRDTGGCLVLQALATEPGLQGRGIGSQLVRAGTERADAEGLPCWAHASPAGHALYERNGFREVARDDYPLAASAPAGEGASRGWGTYTFRYMLRPVGGDGSGGA